MKLKQTLKWSVRKEIFRRLTKEFFEDYNKLNVDLEELQPFWLNYQHPAIVPEQTVTVLMMHSMQPNFSPPRKPSMESRQYMATNMASELARYGTFERWPKNFQVFPSRLAAAGFFYTGSGDTVKCFSCQKTRNNWRHGQQPMLVHREISPDCSFVQGHSNNEKIVADSTAKEYLIQLTGGSLPLGGAAASAVATAGSDNLPFVTYPTDSKHPNSREQSSGQQAVSQQPEGMSSSDSISEPSLFPLPARSTLAPSFSSMTPSRVPVIPNPLPEVRPLLSLTTPPRQQVTPPQPSAQSSSNTAPARGTSTQQRQQSPARPSPRVARVSSDLVTSVGALGISTERPKHPAYAVTASRVSTYTTWPRSHSQTPTQLAEAGFYYSKNGDSVRCFFCGTGLRNWDDGDSPWVEHARWAPKCVYLIQSKGQQFVDLVQELNTDGSQIDYQQVMSILADMAGGTEHTHATEDIRKPDPKTPDSKDPDVMVKGEHSESSHTGEPDSLVEENERLKQQTMCKICLDKEVTIVFLPCGHLVCCAECAPALRKCPMCRSEVKGTVRAFMS